jgi:copper homeostasis protein
MTQPVRLEVIATGAADAVAAAAGGAHRLELLAVPERGGFTPSVETFLAVRAAVDLPLRVMLRCREGFAITPRELGRLRERARALRRAGATEFVLGFLDADNALDLDAMAGLLDAAEPEAWTLHRAFDHAGASRRAWEEARALPHLDLVLSAGRRDGLDQGWTALRDRAAWQDGGPRWLAGGGLDARLIPALVDAGIRQLHTGRSARGGDWRSPVSEAAVRQLVSTAARAEAGASLYP